MAVEFFNSSENARQCLLVDTHLAADIPLPSAASVVVQYDLEWNRSRLHQVRLLCQRLAAHGDITCYV